jgi:hypothetical protein
MLGLVRPTIDRLSFWSLCTGRPSPGQTVESGTVPQVVRRRSDQATIFSKCFAPARDAAFLPYRSSNARLLVDEASKMRTMERRQLDPREEMKQRRLGLWFGAVLGALTASMGFAGCGGDTPGSAPSTSTSTMTGGGQGQGGDPSASGGSSNAAGRDTSNGGGNGGAMQGNAGASLAGSAGTLGSAGSAGTLGSAGAPTDAGNAVVDASMALSCAASDGGPQTNCGGSGQRCCVGNRCTGASLVCDLEGNCIGCGGDDKPCCPGNTCGPDLCCLQGTAQGDKAPAHCHSLNHCENCGGLTQPCCIRESCTGGTCKNNMCVACGASGQVCCDR